jgi:hypothetical protein
MWALLVAVGCTQSPADRATAVCDAFCTCAGGLQATVDACNEQCLALIPPVTDPCLQCVYDHETSCAALDTCQQLCFSQAPNPRGN